MRGRVDRASGFQKVRGDRAVQRQTLRWRGLFVYCLTKQIVLERDRRFTLDENIASHGGIERVEHLFEKKRLRGRRGIREGKRTT